jgi:hypothetical protein
MTDRICIWVAWLCYWYGDLVYRINDGLLGGHLPGGYRLYFYAMQAADWWQGDLEGGPWEPVEGSDTSEQDSAE